MKRELLAARLLLISTCKVLILGGVHMAVPAFFEFFPVILEILSTGEVKSNKEIREEVKPKLILSDEEINELLPSKKQTVFANRVGWAITYLYQAGLFIRPKRGNYQLSEVGKQYVLKNGYGITLEELTKYDSFNKFLGVDEEKVKDDRIVLQEDTDKKTPEDTISDAFALLNQQLADELLAEIKSMSPLFFEKLVLELLIKMGYGGKDENSIVRTPYSSDDGIDGMIKEDELGLDYIYLQAKRWEGVVGQPEIQKFVGALLGQGAKKGVFITTSSFTKKAIDYAKSNHSGIRIVLVDGGELAELMIVYGLGVATEVEYKIQKIDTDYFNEES